MSVRRFFAAALLAVASSPALAQSFVPTVPSPSNPFPENPIATNGSSLSGAIYGRAPVAARGSFVSEVSPATADALRVR